MLIAQSPKNPSAIRNAIVDILQPDVERLWIAAAYVTKKGSDILLESVLEFLDEARLNEIPKTLITSFDFGLTEPAALTDWNQLANSEVRVAGSKRVAQGSLTPSRAFHPKFYAFGVPQNRANLVIGSPNLTSRGLTINTEAAWAQKDVPRADIQTIMTAISEGTVPLDDPLLAAYTNLRNAHPPPPPLQQQMAAVPAPSPVPIAQLQTFRAAVELGALDPHVFSAIWIQVENLQGGSRNQLELPREAHRFFGFQFAQFDFPDKITIGTPVLRAGKRVWNDRLLTWHGNNDMERINLPTASKGGFLYQDSAVMFRRLPDATFELVVAPWQSDLAKSWRSASRAKNRLYRLGKITHRLVGLI